MSSSDDLLDVLKTDSDEEEIKNENILNKKKNDKIELRKQQQQFKKTKRKKKSKIDIIELQKYRIALKEVMKQLDDDDPDFLQIEHDMSILLSKIHRLGGKKYKQKRKKNKRKEVK